ncbi:MAG: ATP-binding protein [Prevotella sp.]|nr:ATP-binding protein [Prevotella sp.]
MEAIKRDFYLKELIDSRHNGFIKIITGIRRSGKTFLLFELFKEFLLSEGVSDDHIIRISLENLFNEDLREPKKMLSYIESLIIDKQMYYLLIDEVQMLDKFVAVLNSLLHHPNVDTYVTGSNSKFLSRDVVTEFRGRGEEIHIFPLSFAEYYSAVGGDINRCWMDYYRYGGLPQLLSLETAKKKEDFLQNIFKTIYLRDLIERYTIKNEDNLQELLSIISSSIGSPCNPNKLSNTFQSVKGVKVDYKTIAKYLSYMEDAFLVEKSMRYDIKGKKYINTLSKYYFQDIGLRNASLEFRQIEESHLMENIIYNELRRRGFRVNVGIVDAWKKEGETRSKQHLEVDFVAEMGSSRFYIQSALSIPNKEKREQEIASLRKINDSFRRIIIVKNYGPYHYDDNGFIYMDLFDFLLNPKLLFE